MLSSRPWVLTPVIDRGLSGPSGGTRFSDYSKVCKHMVCALLAPSVSETFCGDSLTQDGLTIDDRRYLGDGLSDADRYATTGHERADAKDPFDDFEEDDFDDDFDDDFEEDWEDDLTEDDEFPDTFGGADEPDEDEAIEPAESEESPFADDPDFDDA